MSKSVAWIVWFGYLIAAGLMIYFVEAGDVLRALTWTFIAGIGAAVLIADKAYRRACMYAEKVALAAVQARYDTVKCQDAQQNIGRFKRALDELREEV